MDLNQVTLGVTDFKAAIRFYETLGLKLIVSERGEYARFEAPSGSSTFSIHEDPNAIPGTTMIYFEVDDLDDTFCTLSGKGVVFDDSPRLQPWLWKEVHLRDPSGNNLCLYQAGRNRRFSPWRLAARAGSNATEQ